MKAWLMGVLCVCAVGLSGCGPSAPPQASFNKPAVASAPPINPGPTQAESGPQPPAFDRYGNANFDNQGTYIGGHGVGTLVDNPDATSFGIPKTNMPDISNMHCTGSSGANAGTLNCTIERRRRGRAGQADA
jgi:hypothetical protein